MARGRGKATPQDLEAMKHVSTTLIKLMEEHNFKQSQLADILGIPRSSFNEYIKGNTLPKPGNVQKIADYFGLLKSDIDPRFASTTPTQKVEVIPSTLQKVTYTTSQLEHKRQLTVLDFAENQLKEQTAEQNTVEDSKDTVANNVVQFPKLFPYDFYDQPASAGTGQYLNDVQVETIELPVEYDADFVIPIYGDSMEPEYHSGDYVFVKLSVDLSDGDIGVFEYYGDAYVKQLVINDSGAFLHSLNDEYDDIPVDADSDFRIIGEVVGIYRENRYK